jgi:hypothetical protein
VERKNATHHHQQQQATGDAPRFSKPTPNCALKSEEATKNNINHACNNRLSIHNEAAEEERLLLHQQHDNGRHDAIPPVPRCVLARSSSGGCLPLVMGRTGHGLVDSDGVKPYYSNVDNDFVRRRQKG